MCTRTEEWHAQVQFLKIKSKREFWVEKRNDRFNIVIILVIKMDVIIFLPYFNDLLSTLYLLLIILLLLLLLLPPLLLPPTPLKKCKKVYRLHIGETKFNKNKPI
jgi:hypothetical protein